MTPGVGYPLALMLATVLAISSARAVALRDRPRIAFEVPVWLIQGFPVLLGLASLAFGTLNPETMAGIGLEGIAAP